MLEVFRNEIPKLEELETAIQNWLRGPSEHLEDLRELIFDHIVAGKEGETEVEMEETANEAMTTAFNVIDYLIGSRYEFEVNEINFRRLKNYIEDVYSFEAYERLIEDFDKFMSNDERKSLIKAAKRIFIEDVTKHWSY